MLVLLLLAVIIIVPLGVLLPQWLWIPRSVGAVGLVLLAVQQLLCLLWWLLLWAVPAGVVVFAIVVVVQGFSGVFEVSVFFSFWVSLLLSSPPLLLGSVFAVVGDVGGGVVIMAGVIHSI